MQFGRASINSDMKKSNSSRKDYKEALFKKRKEKGDGGDVVSVHEFTFEEISEAKKKNDPNSPYRNKTNRYLKIRERFNKKENVSTTKVSGTL